MGRVHALQIKLKGVWINISSLQKSFIKANIISLIVYPFFIVTCAIVNLFQNKSFDFFGFSLNVCLEENSGSVSLNISIYFILTIAVIYVVSFLLFLGYEKFIKNKNLGVEE